MWSEKKYKNVADTLYLFAHISFFMLNVNIGVNLNLKPGGTEFATLYPYAPGPYHRNCKTNQILKTYAGCSL